MSDLDKLKLPNDGGGAGQFRNNILHGSLSVLAAADLRLGRNDEAEAATRRRLTLPPNNFCRSRGPACATAGHAGACACEAGSWRGGARSAGAGTGALPRRAEGRRRGNLIPLPVRDGAVRRRDCAGHRCGGTAGKTAGARRCGGTTVADVRRGAAARYVARARGLDRCGPHVTNFLSTSFAPERTHARPDAGSPAADLVADPPRCRESRQARGRVEAW